MNPKVQVFKDQMVPAVPEFYYNSVTKEFLFKQTGDIDCQNWVSMPKEEAGGVLALAGVNCEIPKGERMSEVTKMLYDARLNSKRTVEYVGPIAGYHKGFVRENGFNALITVGPTIYKAVPGDWSYIRTFIDGLFGEHAKFIYSYLKFSREMLIDGDHRGMPAIIMVGDRGCGKSFFQEYIMSPVLGNRQTDAGSYLTGKSVFNRDIFTNEHIFMGDCALSIAYNDRRTLGNNIKMIVANDTKSMHAKFKDAFRVAPFTRLSISLNSEVQNINGLPVMDDSIGDKIMLFNVGEVVSPVKDTTPKGYRTLKDTVLSQIPAFCWYLDHEWVVPEELTYDHRTGKPARFCIDCHHDPYILNKLVELSQEYRLLELIKLALFTNPIIPKADAWAAKKPTIAVKPVEVFMSSLEIDQALKSESSNVWRQAHDMHLTSYVITQLLQNLSKKFPNHVIYKHTAGARKWTIRGVDEMLGSVISWGERG